MTSTTIAPVQSWFAPLARFFSFTAKAAPIADPFKPITARDLINAANIEPEARALAVQRLPHALHASPSNAEARAAEIVETRVRARAETVGQKKRGILERLTEVPDPRADRNMAHLSQHVTNLIMHLFHQYTPTVRTIVAKERNTKAEYDAWRDAHKLLHREPVYPVSKVLHFAAVAVLLLLEATGNAFMFFNASDNGWLGAYATALLVAAVNVGLAVLAGYAPCRYLNHMNTRHRTWAIPTLGVAAFLILINNFYAAHYRDLATATTGVSFDEFQVAARMIADPFGLSPTSYAFFIFGVLFALLAVRKGYTGSDPYPGFEPQHRRYADTLEDADYLKTDIHGGLESIRKAEIVYAADKPLATRALIEAIRKSYAALVIEQDQARDLDAGDIKALTTALRRFRDLNLQIRTDGIVPGSFRREPEFSHLLTPRETESALAQQIEAISEQHIEHTDQFQQLINRLLRQIETAKDKTETIMRAIEASFVDESALPKLADLRAILEPQLDTNKTGDK